MPLRVLKLGGSLLDLPDWPTRLKAWITTEPVATNLVIVGGGPIVDAVRDLDRIHSLDEQFAHWLCIDLLQASFEIAKHLLPDVPAAATAEELKLLLDETQSGNASSTTSSIVLVAVSAFYSRQNPDDLLAESWDTTSDSLAGLLASRCQAELVLFKSQAAEDDAFPAELATRGYIDQTFPALAPHLARLRFVNLRQF